MARYDSPMDKLNEALNTYKNMRSALDYRSPQSMKKAQSQQAIGAAYEEKALRAYNNEDLQREFDNFSNYYTENLSGMSAETLDQMDFIKQQYVDQFNKNVRFEADTNLLVDYESSLKDMIEGYEGIYNKDQILAAEYGDDAQLLMPSYIQDGTATQEQKDLWSSDLRKGKEKARRLIVEDIKQMSEKFGTHRNNMLTTYYDRIGPGGKLQHVGARLEEGKESIGFVLGSLTDDGVMDSGEYNAYVNYLDSGNIQFVQDYKAKENAYRAELGGGWMKDIEIGLDRLQTDSKAVNSINDYLSGTIDGGYISYYDEQSGSMVSEDLSEMSAEELNALRDELAASNARQYDILERKDKNLISNNQPSVLQNQLENMDSSMYDMISQFDHLKGFQIYDDDGSNNNLGDDEGGEITDDESGEITDDEGAGNTQTNNQILNELNQINAWIDANPSSMGETQEIYQQRIKYKRRKKQLEKQLKKNNPSDKKSREQNMNKNKINNQVNQSGFESDFW
tara:strand:+ start:276 stop:1802 length:1527 start_codon:yes stop_codon:yes gene_type:complete